MTEVMTIGAKQFFIGREPYVMGILNVTPDSFSDGGSYEDIDKALFHTKKMIEEGASIIDVGGESARPGYNTAVSVQEEIERTCFVIEAIKENFDVPVSLDTYKPEVAQAGILAGADMINDIWGLKADDRMAGIIATHKKTVCLMHNRKPGQYGNFIEDVKSDLGKSIELALSSGIEPDKIIIDAGIGFAKNRSQSLAIMNNMDRLLELGFPILLGASRKSVIGDTLNLPTDDREEGTLATSVIGLARGCTFFRVHDVKKNLRALNMANAILKG